MRKLHVSHLCSKSVLLFFAVMLSVAKLYAQTEITIGTGTGGNTSTGYPTPLQDYDEGSRAQYLYKASELVAKGMTAGKINGIKFNVINLNTAGVIEQYTIKILATSATALTSTTWEPGATTVYGPVNYQPVLGMNEFNFTTPFTWDGTSNIIIEVCNGDPNNSSGTYYTSNATVQYSTSIGFNGSHTRAADNLGNLCSTTTTTNTGTQTTRPNATFIWTSGTPCAGTPVGGATQASVGNVCNPTMPFTLSVTGSTNASGLSYQWEQSTDNATWTPIAGATNYYYNISGIGTTTYFRRMITCGTFSSFSTSVPVIYASNPDYAPVPFTESFENTWINVCGVRDVPNNYWRSNPITGDNAWRRNDDGALVWGGTAGAYTPSASAGTYSARFHADLATSGSRGQLDLYLNCSNGNAGKLLKFDYINTSGTDSLVIYVSTNAGASFTKLDTVKTSSVWKTASFTFLSLSATTVIRFEGVSDNGTTDIGLDNIRITEVPPCTGAPAGGTINSTATTVCVGVPFTLSVSGATDIFSASGLTVQWQQSTNGGATWSDISGATDVSYTSPGISVTTSFRRKISCSGTDSYSTVALVSLNTVYTTLPLYESFENNWINGCGTRDVPALYWRNTPSTGNNSWRRNDDGAAGAWTSPTLGAYSPEASDGSFSARFHSYYSSATGTLDLFVNATGANTGKKLSFDYINTSGSDSLVIYLSTDGGQTFSRLDSVRIATEWKTKTIIFGSTSPTTVIRFFAKGDFGSTDIGLDNIAITNFADCSGTPVAGVTASSASSVCTGVPFDLSVSGSTNLMSAYGLSVQWQYSTNGGASWTNIAGATNESYSSTGIFENTTFRRVISCGVTSSSSTPVTVSVTNAPTYAAMPFRESFETNWLSICDVNNAPNNYWRGTPFTGNNSWRRNDDGASAKWTSPTVGMYTPAATDGNFSARFHSYYASSGTKGDLYLFLNANTPSATKRLSFDYINTSGSDSLVISVSTNGGLSFTRLDSVKTIAEWKSKEIIFSSSSAQTVIRFEAVSDYGATDIGLDDVQVVDYPACSGAPLGGTATTTSPICTFTPFTVTVGGGTIASGLTYQWQQSTDGGTTWTSIPGATSEKYMSAGITVPTSFRRGVSCSGSTSYSTPVAVGINAAAYAVLPFTESFEATWLSLCNVREVPNNYWRSSPLTSDASWRRNDDGASAWTNTNGAYTPAASAGVYSARFHSYQAASGRRGALYLHINANTAAATKRLRFDYINTSGSDSLVVSLSTDGGATFARLDSVKTSTVWNTKSIVFSSTSATTVLRFEGVSDYGSTDFGLDNVTVIDFPNCNGAPAGGTTTSSSTFVCPSTPFSVNVIGATDLNGITFQWQQSTDGGATWANISGATSETYTSPGITVNTSIRRQITCSGTNSYSTPIDITLNNPTYVTLPYAESFENTWISGCGLRDIPNNSWRNSPVTGNSSWRRVDDGDAAGWTSPTLGDYNPDASEGIYSARFHSYNATSASKGRFDLYINANTTAAHKRLTFDYINTSGTDSLSVYLSTDGGATFTRLDSVKTAAVWASKAIEFNSLSPTTVIRFEATSDNGSTDFGLDNVLITNFDPCTGLPNAGTASSNKSVVCGDPFTLTLTGSSSAAGVTYQWQRSSDNINFTDIAGATNFSFTTTQTVTTYYRAVVTCTNTNELSNSGSVLIQSPSLVSGKFVIDNSVPTNATNKTFTSFNDAYNYIKCGIDGPVEFSVKDNASTIGIYNEQLIMTPVPGASSVNTVTFKGNYATIGYGSNNTNERAVIKLRGADFIRFDSLIINASSGTYGFGVQLISNADSNIISNCIINSDLDASTSNYAGIVISGSETSPTSTGTVLCDDNVITKNTINGGYLGISLVASPAGANLNNVIANNTIRDFYTYGIYVGGSKGTLIEANSISRPTRSTVGDFYGIYFTGVSTKASISKNKISNPFGGALTSTNAFNGIYFTSVDATTDNENVVSNNLISTINGEGAQTGIYNSSSDNVWYLQNTIALDSLASASTSTTRGLYQTTAAGGILLFNNMITISRGGTGTKHAVYMNTNTTGIIADYNDYYMNSGAGTNAVGYFNTNQNTLGDWQGATKQDAHSISRNPFYADAANGNYKPTSGSVDNKGTYAFIDTDIDNAARSTTTPDIGAYEFTAIPCTLPPDAGNTIFSDTLVCQNSPVRISLTLTSWGATQTFQWQTATSAAGPWTDFGGLREDPDTTIMASTALYYRVGVTCGTTTVYSNPVQLMVSPALPTGVYTINKNDPAGNTYVPGNPGGNFLSFNDAKAAMACGIIGGPVVFNVVPGSGTYNEQLVLDSIPGVSAINTITFNGNGNTIKSTTSTSSERAVIKLRGADHIIFDSLQIEAAGTYYYGVQLAGNADSNTFRRNKIIVPATGTSTDYAGIVISASETGAVSTGNTLCDGNTFDQNTITGGYYGITLMGGTTAATYISNNTFTNNTISDFYNYGFYIGGTYNTLIEGNTFSRPSRTTTAASVYGIYASGALSNRLTISKNRFTNFFGGLSGSTSTFYGIYHNSVDATAGSEVKVINNLIYGINSEGAAYGFYNVGSNNVFYYHNTVSFDDALSTTNDRTAGLYQTTAATGIFFKNNIITIRRGGSGTRYGIYMATTTNTEITASNNDYYITGSNGYVGYRSGNQQTLTQWQAASGQDANSYDLNPLYMDTAAGNYKPQLLAIDNKGTDVDVDTDIENVSRSNSTPDMGAYEFVPIACQTPLTAGTASATPNTGICLETPIHLTVNGHSPLGSITFQWQYSPDGVNNWTNLGPVQYFPEFDTVTTVNTYYRAGVICNGSTVYTDVIHVTLNPLLLQGTYTINSTQATGGTNFNSFQDAVTAMMCGITGPVVFNVATGTYKEQIYIPYIRNTNSVNTVTFQGASGNAADVKLQHGATSATANYTLQLDSTRYFTFRNMSFVADSATYGRAVDIKNTSSNINFLNNTITVPTVSTANTDVTGIYADSVKGKNIVLRGNTINGGSRGIHFTGTSATELASAGHVIDSNKVNNSYQYGIYTEYTNHLMVRGNTVSLALPTADLAAGIYARYADSAFRMTGNTVTITNDTAASAYGIYVLNSRSVKTDSSIIANNRFVGGTGNTGTLYGLTISASKAINVVNNVLSINSAGATAYGLYNLNNTDLINYYNNTSNIEATSANGYAGYFDQSAVASINVFNNIFSNRGNGKALFVNNPSFFSADYNMLYTTGTTLVQVNTGTVLNFAKLKDWTATWNWDRYSISYQPAFVSATDLRPDVTKPDVWAMHGRGTQISGNSYDFNNQKRPETLTAGVPDLGAYEFYPTALPTVLTATPAAPAANSTQTFTYGTDTVMKITWGATAPPSVEVRRFSGVVPSGLLSSQDSMFFYTKVDIPGGANYNYAAKLYYINPWQGSIPQQYMIGLGRTTPSNAWVVGQNSKVNVGTKEISQDAIIYLDRFTGLVNPFAKPESDDSTSNRGKDFWVGYQRTNGFGTTPTSAGSQDMVIYMGAGDQEANVTITIEGTSGTPWVRTYKVPANTTVTSEIIPKSGANDARLFWEGFHDNKGIHITSDVPIVAYAHIYESANSGATMLMPSTVWGYEYYTLSSRQDYTSTSYAAFHVVAQHDSTWVEINPSAPTRDGWMPNGGTRPNGSYLVKLNKGDVYQVLGAIMTGSEGYDLSGSYVKSVAGPTGCYPIAVFAGSTRTGIGCGDDAGSSGDLIIQQIFPYQAWGTKYLVAPTSNQNGPSGTSNMTNIYRVLVKDPTTIVKRNGTILPQTSLVNSRYYQFESDFVGGDYIESNKPVLVAQYMSSSGNCPNTTGDGDPEMFYISPLEQAIKKTQFYRNNKTSIDENFITLVIPTEGLQTLRIDGVNHQAYPTTDRAVVTHTYNGYSIVTKRWASGAGSSTVESDYPFTGIVYGIGSVESYGYNLGTLVKNLNNLSNINTTLNTGTTPTGYTCSGAPFQVTAYLPLIPDSLRFNITAVSGLTPATNVTIKNPTPTSTTEVNGVQYYTFTLPQSFTLGNAGTFTVPIEYWSPEIESCDKKKDGKVIIQVLPRPKTDFQITYPNLVSAACEGETVNLKGDLITGNGIALSQWQWNFAAGGSQTTANGQNQSISYPAAGTYAVKLTGVTADGCISDTTKNIVFNAKPLVSLAQDNVEVCPGTNATFQVSSPISGAVYNWYSAATGGTLLGTGTSFTLNNVTPPASVWVAATSNGCTSVTRKEAKAILLGPLTPANVRVLSKDVNSVTFTWDPVTLANPASYQVSVAGGPFIAANGLPDLTHTVSGLRPTDTVSIRVRAIGNQSCQTSVSLAVTGQTLPDQIYIPNSFSPNGDGKNDQLMVYGYVIKEMTFMVFNQWGEKIFETKTQSQGWDGTHKGKAQPSGVYMYVSKFILKDGSTVERRGSINLIR